MDWTPIIERWKNSVIQLIVNYALHSVTKPYLIPSDSKARGSGFIVDINRGYIITNAHVVSNSITIIGRSPLTGKKDLILDLIGISRDRDIALCKLRDESVKIIVESLNNIKIYNNPSDLNMKFGDDLALVQTEEVMTIGYPLGKENVKATTGAVSGFQYEEDEDDAILGIQNPSYIQVTAAINPGNSGGPLLNKKGEVVGINAAGYMLSQLVGYSIGTRTLISIYNRLLDCNDDEKNCKHKVLKLPQFSISWNKTNEALNKIKCGDPERTGIYITGVLKDSIFKDLEEGDILTHIIYRDPFWTSSEAFVVTDLGINGKTVLDKPNDIVIGDIDNYGEIELFRYDSVNNTYETKLLDRKLRLDELRDIIPLNTDIEIHVCRNKITETIIEKVEDIKGDTKIVEVTESFNTDGTIRDEQVLNMLPTSRTYTSRSPTVTTRNVYRNTLSPPDILGFDNKIMRNGVTEKVIIEKEDIKEDKIEWLSFEYKYAPIDIYRIKYHYLHYERIPYIIFAGMVISHLTLNHISYLSKSHYNTLVPYTKKDKAFKKYLVIARIFPDTTANHVGALESGDILNTVNNYEVRTIEDLKRAIKSSNDVCSIKTMSNKMFVVNKDECIREDIKTYEDFSINKDNYIFSENIPKDINNSNVVNVDSISE